MQLITSSRDLEEIKKTVLDKTVSQISFSQVGCLQNANTCICLQNATPVLVYRTQHPIQGQSCNYDEFELKWTANH